MKLLLLVTVIATVLERISTEENIVSFNIANQRSKIISGNEVKVGEIPWMVAIEARKALGSDFCGGSLISEEWVLTSASCIAKGIKYVLQFGGITTNLIEVGRIEMTSYTSVTHSMFDPLSMNYDVALIQLPKKITLNDRIRLIVLPKKGSSIGNLVSVNIAGWGVTKPGGGHSNKLRHIDLSTTSNSECLKHYGKEEIIDSSLCAAGFLDATPCDGDMGGPLYTTSVRGVSTLVGVFSFYHKNGCDSHKPTVYVRTEPLLSWISVITGVRANN